MRPARALVGTDAQHTIRVLLCDRRVGPACGGRSSPRRVASIPAADAPKHRPPERVGDAAIATRRRGLPRITRQLGSRCNAAQACFRHGALHPSVTLDRSASAHDEFRTSPRQPSYEGTGGPGRSVLGGDFSPRSVGRYRSRRG